MYLPLWALLVIISLLVSLAAFVWGLFAGQFRNPERARYLPFGGGEAPPVKTPGPGLKPPLEVYYLGAVAAVSVFILAAPILLTLYHSLLR